MITVEPYNLAQLLFCSAISIVAGQVSGTLSEPGHKALTTSAVAVNKGMLHFLKWFSSQAIS